MPSKVKTTKKNRNGQKRESYILPLTRSQTDMWRWCLDGKHSATLGNRMYLRETLLSPSIFNAGSPFRRILTRSAFVNFPHERKTIKRLTKFAKEISGPSRLNIKNVLPPPSSLSVSAEKVQEVSVPRRKPSQKSDLNLRKVKEGKVSPIGKKEKKTLNRLSKLTNVNKSFKRIQLRSLLDNVSVVSSDRSFTRIKLRSSESVVMHEKPCSFPLKTVADSIKPQTSAISNIRLQDNTFAKFQSPFFRKRYTGIPNAINGQLTNNCIHAMSRLQIGPFSNMTTRGSGDDAITSSGSPTGKTVQSTMDVNNLFWGHSNLSRPKSFQSTESQRIFTVNYETKREYRDVTSNCSVKPIETSKPSDTLEKIQPEKVPSKVNLQTSHDMEDNGFSYQSERKDDDQGQYSSNAIQAWDGSKHDEVECKNKHQIDDRIQYPPIATDVIRSNELVCTNEDFEDEIQYLATDVKMSDGETDGEIIYESEGIDEEEVQYPSTDIQICEIVTEDEDIGRNGINCLPFDANLCKDVESFCEKEGNFGTVTHCSPNVQIVRDCMESKEAICESVVKDWISTSSLDVEINDNLKENEDICKNESLFDDLVQYSPIDVQVCDSVKSEDVVLKDVNESIVEDHVQWSSTNDQMCDNVGSERDIFDKESVIDEDIQNLPVYVRTSNSMKNDDIYFDKSMMFNDGSIDEISQHERPLPNGPSDGSLDSLGQCMQILPSCRWDMALPLEKSLPSTLYTHHNSTEANIVATICKKLVVAVKDKSHCDEGKAKLLHDISEKLCKLKIDEPRHCNIPRENFTDSMIDNFVEDVAALVVRFAHQPQILTNLFDKIMSSSVNPNVGQADCFDTSITPRLVNSNNSIEYTQRYPIRDCSQEYSTFEQADTKSTPFRNYFLELLTMLAFSLL